MICFRVPSEWSSEGSRWVLLGSEGWWEQGFSRALQSSGGKLPQGIVLLVEIVLNIKKGLA